nr:hypothetical protein CFP56_28206 [Quercus suber]
MGLLSYERAKGQADLVQVKVGLIARKGEGTSPCSVNFLSRSFFTYWLAGTKVICWKIMTIGLACLKICSFFSRPLS